jgi:hypothetical protein
VPQKGYGDLGTRQQRCLTFRGSIPHPHAIAVYAFATTVAIGHATLATKQDATLYLGRTCTGWIAPALRLAHLFNYLVSAPEQYGRKA